MLWFFIAFSASFLLLLCNFHYNIYQLLTFYIFSLLLLLNFHVFLVFLEVMQWFYEKCFQCRKFLLVFLHLWYFYFSGLFNLHRTDIIIERYWKIVVILKIWFMTSLVKTYHCIDVLVLLTTHIIFVCMDFSSSQEFSRSLFYRSVDFCNVVYYSAFRICHC